MWDDDPLSGTGSDPTLTTPDYSGPLATAQAAGVQAQTDYSLAGDASDDAQMASWNTAPASAQASGTPWWAGLAQYGISKAIDNTFPTSPTGTQGNVYPGSGASAAGRTYTQKPTGAGGGVLTVKAAAGGSIAGIPTLYLLGAVALYFVLR